MLIGLDGVAPTWIVDVSPLVILPSTIKSTRSFLRALGHPGDHGKRAVNWLWCGDEVIFLHFGGQS